MGMVRTFSPEEFVFATSAGPATGLAKGTFIKITPMGDGTVSEAGADREVVRAMSVDDRFTVEVTLHQASQSNDDFSELHLADVNSGGQGTFGCYVRDMSGTTVFEAGSAWIPNWPEAEWSTEITHRTWTFHCVGKYFLGGGAIAAAA